MKIGILTQPLHTNYGGLLQAYALQTVLKRMEHEPWIVRRAGHGKRRPKFLQFIINIVKILIGRKPYKPLLLNQSETEYISHRVRIFRDKYITPVTPLLESTEHLSTRTLTDDYDAFVVGSDQVWRPMYSPCISNYFLDFAEGRKVKRIAYAASFGVDEWEFTPDDTKACARLAKQFDAISVRETSAVGLCSKYLGVEAKHVLDPTMLLDAQDYIDIVNAENESPCEGELFCYVLDGTPEKSALRDLLAKKLELTSFTSMPEKPLTRENIIKDIDACVYPTVTRWLRSFMDAQMVLTDSFHGCVFSIIFNKPFWVIGNKSRGMARFHSLLAMYGLEHRLVSPEDAGSVDFAEPIDWEKVNCKREKLRQRSLTYLKQNLNHE